MGTIDIAKLNPAERLDLLEQLWESLAATPDALLLPRQRGPRMPVRTQPSPAFAQLIGSFAVSAGARSRKSRTSHITYSVCGELGTARQAK